MKCPYCHGKGSRHVVDQALKLCLYCQGTGQIEPTNQEYIQNCNTEELEHELTMLIMKDRFFADKDFAYVNTRMKVHHWLREKHDD